MTEWSVGRKISAAVAVGCICLLVIGICAYNSTLKLIATADAVTHTHKMIDDGRAVLTLMKDAGAAQYAYLVSGDEPDLAPYRKAAASAAQSIQQIRAETHNPHQVQRM